MNGIFDPKLMWDGAAMGVGFAGGWDNAPKCCVGGGMSGSSLVIGYQDLHSLVIFDGELEVL